MNYNCKKILEKQGYDINTVGWRNIGKGCVPVDCNSDYNRLWGSILMDEEGRQSYQPGCLDGKLSCIGKECDKNLITTDPSCLMTTSNSNPQASTNVYQQIIPRLGKEWYEQPCCVSQPYTNVNKTWSNQNKYTL